MPFFLRLVLVALAGIWLVGARHASHRFKTWSNEAKVTLREQTTASPGWLASSDKQ